MHVLIEGSLNRLHCCGNETPAANEHRLDCFLGRGRAKTSLWSQSVNGARPPPPPHPCPAPPPPSVFIPLSPRRTVAVSHLLINFLRRQITMLFCFGLHLLYSYWNNKVVPATTSVFPYLQVSVGTNQMQQRAQEAISMREVLYLISALHPDTVHTIIWPCVGTKLFLPYCHGFITPVAEIISIANFGSLLQTHEALPCWRCRVYLHFDRAN